MAHDRMVGRDFAWSGVVVIALALAGCGSSGTSQATQTSTAGSPTATAAGTTGGTATSTTAKPKAKVSYPAGGAVDPVFPPGDQAYTLLTQGQCQVLLGKTREWDAKGVANAEGADTVFVYRSASDVCLHQWSDAVRDFEKITKPKPDFGTNCARSEVYKWVGAIIAAHNADPAFDPVFVADGGQSPCASSTTSSTRGPTTSTTTV